MENSMVDEIAFWGQHLESKKRATVQFNDNNPEIIHISQVALGDKPADGPHVVQLEQGGSKFTLCTLRKGVCDQFNVDLVLGETFSLTQSGGSTVHVTGWRQFLTEVEESDSDEDGEGARLMSEDDEDDEDALPEKPPQKPAAGKKPAAQNPASGAKKPQPSASAGKQQPGKPLFAQLGASDDDDDDDDDDDMEGEDRDDDDMSDDDDDDDDDDEGGFTMMAGEDDDDDDDEENSGDDDDDDDAADAHRKNLLAGSAGKRPAQAQAQAPQQGSAKKAKTETPGKVAAVTPAKTPAGKAAAAVTPAKTPAGKAAAAATPAKMPAGKAAAVTPAKTPAKTPVGKGQQQQQAKTPDTEPKVATPATAGKTPGKAALGALAKTPATEGKGKEGAGSKTPATAGKAGAKTPATSGKGDAKTPATAGKGDAKTPAAKTPASTGKAQVMTPGTVDEYKKNLVEYLEQYGRTAMAALGGKVKKPAGVDKLANFIKQHTDTFKVVGDQIELSK